MELQYYKLYKLLQIIIRQLTQHFEKHEALRVTAGPPVVAISL